MYHTVLQQLSCMYIVIQTNLFVYKKQDIFLEKLRQLMLIFLFTQSDMYCRFLYNLFTWRYIRPLGKIFILVLIELDLSKKFCFVKRQQFRKERERERGERYSISDKRFEGVISCSMTENQMMQIF